MHFKTILPAKLFVLLVFFCCFLLPCASYARSSVNIPVGTRLYDDFERLEQMDLLDSSMLSTKPFDRFEGARLLNEALEKLSRSSGERASEAWPVLNRLKRALRKELAPANEYYSALKPFDSIYLKTVWADNDPYFTDINNNGDLFRGGLNQRVGFILIGKLFDTVSFYLNPEFIVDEDYSRGRIARGYAKMDVAGLTLQLGRDSMWWGSGMHGGLLMTDNAKPFDMIKVSSQHPFLLPWIFRGLGPFKPTVFIGRLENDRDFPRPNLLGMRLDFKPTPRFQFAFNRVFLFGGEGRKSLTLADWAKLFVASDSAEHMQSPINGDQIVSVDFSYLYVTKRKYLPFSAIKVYTEWGAEDSAGDKTPTGRANIYGALIDEPLWLGNVDLRVEWANTARNARYAPSWYSHGIYTSGYTFKGRVIGHHMGTGSRDLFLRSRYWASSGLVVGVEFDYERSGFHSNQKILRRWFGADIDQTINDNMNIKAGLGVEDIEANGVGSGTNQVAWLRLEWKF